MRILIADDEAPTRIRMKQLLAAHPDVEVAGEAESGVQAMEMLAHLQPDVILLDIQMPGCSGIDVAACLREPRPHLIFCTAWDQYAVEAFELNAVDYLLKPVARARLAQALDRIRSLGPTVRRDVAVDNVLRGQSKTARFLVRSGAQYRVVGESRVLYFGTEGSLTRLVAADGQFWMDPSLNELEQRLDPTRFFRISRAALVNLNAVTNVIPVS
jgi:two-component system, LytTR family, response regulator